MKCPAYPKYKESGVAWLGEVPEGWEAMPLRRLARVVKTGGTPSGAEDHFFEENGFDWFTPSDFSEDAYLGQATRKLSNLGKEEVRLFPPMTVMMVGIGATIGKVALAKEQSSCNQQINGIVFGDRLYPIFATYYLKTMRDFIMKCGKFTTMPIINQDETKNLLVTVPSYLEQTAIAVFLDRETGRIDTLVAKKRSLIGLLKEKRSALISRTVTRGLPADVAHEFGLEPHTRFKDSGIDWLGEVPVGWEVKRIKEVSTIVGRIGFRGYSTDDLVCEDEGAISMSPSNMAGGTVNLSKCTFLSWEKYYESPEIMVEAGDIVMVKTGSTIGKTVMVESVSISMTINPQLMIFKGVKCSNRFLFYYLFSKAVQDLIPLHNTGSTIPTMTQESIGKLGVPYPSPPEQTAIATYLDRETSKIDRLVEKVEAAIARLLEYRAALITAAVTGKIDVRERAS